MVVYVLPVQNASCPVQGCGCHDRARSYPSDLTDAQWEVLRPEAEAVMTELRWGPGGARIQHLRAMLDAIGYVTRYGIEWRTLLVDFSPWPAAYAFFDRWSRRGTPQRPTDRLRGRIRVVSGRKETPTAAVMDSQSATAAETVGAGASGWDGGKKLKGEKRHIAVDTLGLLLTVVVTAACVPDRDGAHPLLAGLAAKFSTVRLVWADGGYAGRLVT